MAESATKHANKLPLKDKSTGGLEKAAIATYELPAKGKEAKKETPHQQDKGLLVCLLYFLC